MSELIIISLGGQPYGIWREEVLRTAEVKSLHSLPMTPKHFAGMADIEERMASLYDLSNCMGHADVDKRKPCRAIMISDIPTQFGFAYNYGEDSVSASKADLIPLPSGMDSYDIEGLIIDGQRIITVIDIQHLFARAMSDHWSPPTVGFEKPAALPAPSAYRTFTLGGQSFAADNEGLAEKAVAVGDVFNLPIAPRHIAGVTLVDGAPNVLVDTNTRVELKSPPGSSLISAEGGTSFVVDADGSVLEASGCTVMILPELARSSIMDSAIADGIDIIPVLKREKMLIREPGVPFEEMYKGNSGFAGRFGGMDHQITEFTLLGEPCSVPGEQVKDVLDFVPYRSIPGIHSIMIGVARHGGELLPVIDLSLCYGMRSLIKPDWKFILIENGSFKALVPTPEVKEKFTLHKEAQHRLPIAQDRSYVYGCYTIEERVRLILNVKVLTTHFDKDMVSRIFDGMFKGLGEGTENPWAVDVEEFERAREAARLAAEAAKREAGEAARLAAEEGAQETIGAKPEQIETDTKTEPDLSETPEMLSEVEEPTTEPEEQEQHADLDMLAAAFLSSPDDDEAEEAARREAEEAARREAEEAARREAEKAAARREAEEAARREAEEAARREAEEVARREAEEAARREAEEVARREAEEVAKREAEEVARREAEEIARREAEEVARREAELQGQVSAEEAHAEKLKNIRIPKKEKRGIPWAAILLLLLLMVFVIPTAYFYFVENARPPKTPPEPAVRKAPEPEPAPLVVEPEPAPEPVEEIAQPEPETEPVAVEPRPGPKEEEMVIYAPPETKPTVHVVVRGDTLWHISKRYMGDPYKYPEVARKNKIRNPDRIYPGQKVKIKPIDR